MGWACSSAGRSLSGITVVLATAGGRDAAYPGSEGKLRSSRLNQLPLTAQRQSRDWNTGGVAGGLRGRIPSRCGGAAWVGDAGTPQWPGSQQVAAPGPAVAVASLSEVLAPGGPRTQPCGPGLTSASVSGGSACARTLGCHWVSWERPSPCERPAGAAPALLVVVGGCLPSRGSPHTHRSLLFDPVPVLLGPQLEEGRG